MTFAILAGDDTGAIGMAVSSSSPAVAARCIHLRPGVGGVASQNITDPRLGSVLLDRLEKGQRAQGALDEVTASTTDIAYRQLLVLDADGNTAHFSGEQTLGVYAASSGPRMVAAGNLLGNPDVPAAIAASFAASDGELERRLVKALAAGEEAGGEAGPVQSAGVSVVRDAAWRVTDLRVDFEDCPITKLSGLVEHWLPQRDDFVTRGLYPGGAPSFGVPGDE